MTVLLEHESNWATPVGEMLLDSLEDFAMSPSVLAEKAGVSQALVDDVIEGRAEVTPSLSASFSRAFGIDDLNYWTNLQDRYYAKMAELDENKARLREILDTDPIRTLVDRGYIQRTNDPDIDASHLLEFFDVGGISSVYKLYSRITTSLRQSEKVVCDPLALACWLRCCEIASEQIDCEKYDREKFVQALSVIRSWTADTSDGFFQRVKELCASCGVAVVAVPEFKRGATNGAVKWDGPDRAVLMINLKGKYSDIFWFSFFHEAAHILYGDKQGAVDGWQQEDDDDEQRANQFARNFLIPEQYQTELYQLRSRNDILAFAKKIGIHPGIVVGRLHKDGPIGHHVYNDLRSKFKWSN